MSLLCVKLIIFERNVELCFGMCSFRVCRHHESSGFVLILTQAKIDDSWYFLYLKLCL